MITDAHLRKASFQGVLHFPRIHNPDKSKYAAVWIRSKEPVKRDVYIKPGEPPDKAIKRFMNSIKIKPEKRSFPKAFKSTADYVAQYAYMNKEAACLTFTNLSTTGFAMNEGEEVIYTEIEEETCDLI